MLKTLPDRKILSSEMQNKYIQSPSPEKTNKSSQNLDNGKNYLIEAIMKI